MMDKEDKHRITLTVLLKQKKINVIEYSLLLKFIKGMFSDPINYDFFAQCVNKLNELYDADELSSEDIIDFIDLGIKKQNNQ